MTYTKDPNWLYELMHKMGDAELRVVLCIVRQTFGYHRDWDEISLTQFETMTGLSRQGVINGIEAATKRGIIERKSAGKQGFLYRTVKPNDTKVVNAVDQLDDEPVNELDQSTSLTSQRRRPEVVYVVDQSAGKVVNVVDPQKKDTSLKKERKRVNNSSVCEVKPKTSVVAERNDDTRNRDIFFELYAWICGIDWQTCNDNKRGQLNQACGKLKAAGYTEQDLRAFWQDVWLTDWRWTKHGSRPTIQQVRNEIGKVRDDPIPGEQQGAMTEISNIDWSDLSKINPDELSMDARSVYYSLKYDREIATTA